MVVAGGASNDVSILLNGGTPSNTGTLTLGPIPPQSVTVGQTLRSPRPPRIRSQAGP